MKKVISTLCTGIFLLSLNACSKNPAGPASPAKSQQMKIQGGVVTAWKFVKNIEIPFDRPHGLAYNPRTNQLSVVDMTTGKVWYSYGVYWEKYAPTGQNQLTLPTGIAANPSDGSLYVSDAGHHRIQRYSYPSWMTMWGIKDANNNPISGTQAGAFNGPAGIACEGTKVYICDKSNYRIQVMDIRLNTISITDLLSTSTYQPVTFMSPEGIAVDGYTKYVYVTDANNRVIKFKNKLVDRIWDGTHGAGKFSHPSGIALSPSGWDVYVIDTGNNRVQVFDNNGNYVNSFGAYGTGNGQFRFTANGGTYGAGIVVKAGTYQNDWVYVADPINNRVQLWQKYQYVPAGTDYKQ